MEEVRRTWGPSYKTVLAQYIVRESIKQRPTRPSSLRQHCELANHFDGLYMKKHAKEVKPQPHTNLNFMKYMSELLASTEVDGKRMTAIQVGGKGQPWCFVESSQAAKCALGMLDCKPSASGFFQPTVDEQSQVIVFVGGVGSGKTSASRAAAGQAVDEGVNCVAVNCASGNLLQAAENQGNWAFGKNVIVQVNSFEEYLAHKLLVNAWQKEMNAEAVLHVNDDVGCVMPQSTGTGVQQQSKDINQYYAGVRMPVSHHLINVHTVKQAHSMLPHISSLFIGCGGGKGLLGHLQRDPATIDDAHAQGIDDLLTTLAPDFAVLKMGKAAQREAAVALHAGHEHMRQEAIATKLLKGSNAIILTGPNRMRPVKIDGVGCQEGTVKYHVKATNRAELSRVTYTREELHSGFTGNIFVKVPTTNKEFYIVRRAEEGSALGPGTVPGSKWFVPPPPSVPVEFTLDDFEGIGSQAAESTDGEGIVWEDGQVHHARCCCLNDC